MPHRVNCILKDDKLFTTIFIFGSYCGVYMLFSFISKGPKPKTIADFWTMIWQEDVYNVVCLTNLTEGTKVRVNMRDIKYKISIV